MLSACVIGSTRLVTDCCEKIKGKKIAVTHLLTNDLKLKDWAKANSITTPNLHDSVFNSSDFFSQFDYLFSIVNDVIIPNNILKAVKVAAINYHNSPLPKYAGMNAAQWALINGEKVYGVTWHVMHEKVDCGPILTQECFHINEEDNFVSVTLKCFDAAKRSFDRLLDLLELANHSPRKILQSSILNKSIPKNLTKHYTQPSAFCMLPIHCSAEQIYNFVKGTCSIDANMPVINMLGLPKLLLFESATTFSTVAIVTSIIILPDSSVAPPGKVLRIDNNLVVSTGDKDICITGLARTDGSHFTKPFSVSLSHLIGCNLHFDSAHQDKSPLSKVSRIAAKYERKWVKQESQAESMPLLVWPYQTCLVQNIANDDPLCKYQYVDLITLNEAIISKLEAITSKFSYSADILALSAVLLFTLTTSPSLSGRCDVYCKNLPVHHNLLCICVLQSLKVKGTSSFKQTMFEISNQLHNAIDGVSKNGFRQDVLPSDVFLRYPKILNVPENLLAVEIVESFDQHSLHNQHEVVVCAELDTVVSLKARVKCSVFHKYSFSTFENDFHAFLIDGLNNPDKSITNLLLSPPENTNIIASALTGLKTQPLARCLHEPIEEKAQLFPGVTAVIDESGEYTYHNIMVRAVEIAQSLLQMFGLSKRFRVALLLERTWEAISAMYGVLKAGGCFVLLEDNYPNSTLVSILQDTGAQAILVNDVNSKKDANSLNVPLIGLNSIEQLIDKSIHWPSVNSDDPAIIICTSGTTGKPKGVILKHSSLCNYMTNLINVFNLKPTCEENGTIKVQECSLCCSSFNFDGSLHETFPILWIGGTIMFHPSNPVAESRMKSYFSKTTFLFIQPTKLPSFNPSHFSSLRTLSVGGEAFTNELLKPWRKEGRTIWNVYGPCETTIGCTLGRIEDNVHLGSPVSNVFLQILTSSRQKLPMGIPGELHVSGAGLSSGYTVPKLNDEYFWVDTEGKRWYRTKDMVLLDVNKELHYIGRIPKDRQVKLHSIRLELSGIENVIRRLPGVKFAHVKLEDVTSRVQRLVAFVAPEHLDVSEINMALIRELPSSAIPAKIVPISLSSLSFTPAGKLEAIENSSKYISNKLSLPSDGFEQEVLKLYTTLLGAESEHNFGMESDAIEFGADSVIVSQLAADLTELLNYPVSAKTIHDAHTPRKLLSAVRSTVSIKQDISWHEPMLVVEKKDTSQRVIDHYSSSKTDVCTNARNVSYFQEVLSSMNSKSIGCTYNISYVWQVSGNVNGLQLGFVIERLLPLLHAAYNPQNRNKSSTSQSLKVVHMNLQSMPSVKEAFDAAIQRAQLDAVTPIDFNKCPLKSVLYYLGNQSYLISIIAHHIIFDQQTWKNFINLFEVTYKNPDQFPTNISPFSVFVSHEEQLYLNSYDHCWKFWKLHLANCKPFVQFPTSFCRTKQLHFFGKVLTSNFSQGVSVQINERCASLTNFNVRPFTFFLAMFGLLIAKLSKTDCFAVGVTLNQRKLNKDLLEVFGMVLAVLPCCFQTSTTTGSYFDLLCYISEWFFNASKYSALPYLELAELWGRSKTTHHLPQFLFNFASEPLPNLDLGEKIKVTKIDVETYTSKAELTLDVWYDVDNSYYQCSWEYNSTLFTEDFMRKIADKYSEIISACVQNLFTSVEKIDTSSFCFCPVEIKIPILKESVNQTKLQPLSTHQRIIYEEYINATKEESACFHSVVSMKCETIICTKAKEFILSAIKNFPMLTKVIASNGNEQYFTEKPNVSINLIIETVHSDSEAYGVRHRFQVWPFDLCTGPLFRCALLQNPSIKRSELLFVVHQVILSEYSLYDLGQEIWSAISSAKSSDMAQSAMVMDISGNTTKSVKKIINYFSCSKIPNFLNIVADRHSNEILHGHTHPIQEQFIIHSHSMQDYVAHCCLFTSLLLSTLLASKHTHFALLCPVIRKEECIELLVPLCYDINFKHKLSDMLSSLKDLISDVLSNALVSEYSYWSLQKDVHSFSTYLDPFHDVLIKVLPTAIDSENMFVQYPRPFKLCLTFNSQTNKLVIVSALNVQQTSYLKAYLTTVANAYHKFVSQSNSNIFPLSLPLSSTAGDVSPVQNQNNLSMMIDLSFQSNKDSVAFCDISSHNYVELSQNKTVCNQNHQSLNCFYTYGEVYMMCKALAKDISSVVSETGIITIVISKGIALPISVLACALASQPFTVIDTTENPIVTQEKLANVSISLVLFDMSSIDFVEKVFSSKRAIFQVVEPFLTRKYCFNSTNNVKHDLQPKFNDTAFLVFTSGSTGKPKATPVTKKSLKIFFHWFRKSCLENQPLIWLQFLGFSFDVFIAEIITHIFLGGTMVLSNPGQKLDIDHTIEYMKYFNIEAIHLVPTVLNMLLNSKKFTFCHLPHLKHVLSCGERLMPDLCCTFYQKFPPSKKVMLHNWGGPSECTIAYAHTCVNNQMCLSVIPCGYPVHLSEIQVVGMDSFEQTSFGFPGELIISGPCVFNGYALNESNALVNHNGKVWYRSGDIGYLTENKEVVIVKRVDSQVKLHGQRVDLEGIRKRILDLNLEYLLDVQIQLIEIKGVKYLISFPLISKSVSLDEESVQQIFSTYLPTKFIPLVVKCMKDYPLLLSQKINSQELRKIAMQKFKHKSTISTIHSPSTLQTKLTQYIKELQPAIENCDLHLSLDAYGFDSIMKAQLHQKLLSDGFTVSISSILSASTLMELCTRILSPAPVLPSTNNITTYVSQGKAIAIISMYVQVADICSVDQFWSIIEKKVEKITHTLPKDVFIEAELKYKGKNHQYIGSRGILPHKKLFDTSLFGISPLEAPLLDPQQRVLLQAVWHAIEQAGYDPVKFNEKGRIGLFAGAQFPSYIFNILRSNDHYPSHSLEDISWATLRDNVALRIGRILDFRGPCVTFANNCATFLVALHYAQNSLLSNECDMAVVASATVSGQDSGYVTNDGDIFSKDGKCRPFSVLASGTVMSDGVAVIIIRRLEDAKMAGDNIDCLIKGTAIGSDGARAVEKQLQPSVDGQLETLRQVFINSGVDPSGIGLIEAHGTATRVGDQIELESLCKAFQLAKNTPCPIGSVKGNIGHTGVTAAGHGIIKAVMALKMAKIPPTINCDDPFPNLKDSAFYVNTEIKDWVATKYPRQALVHSVGALGTNSAVVLEEILDYKKHKKYEKILVSKEIFYPFCISANSKYSLIRMANNIANLLKNNEYSNLKDLSFSLLYSRRFLSFRSVILHKSAIELESWFNAFNEQTPVFMNNILSNCFMFAGQGILVEPTLFYHISNLLPTFKKSVMNSFEALQANFPAELGEVNLQELLDDSSYEKPAQLKQPSFQHVLLVIAQIGLYESMCYLGVEGQHFIGHSLGEYTAACLAGAFTTEEVIKIVFKRGLLIEEFAPPGCMLSVTLSSEDIHQYLSLFNDISISCFNSNQSCVLSGSPESISNIARVFEKSKIEFQHLPMNYAYHHSSMKNAKVKYEDFLKCIKSSPLRKPLITCSQGDHCKLNTVGSFIPMSYWSEHLLTPCHFIAGCKLLHFQNTLFVEVGLKPILTKFMPSHFNCASVALLHSQGKSTTESILHDFVNVWGKGGDLQLNKLPIFEGAHRIDIPLYSFKLEEFWIGPLETQTIQYKPVKEHIEVNHDSVLNELIRFTGQDTIPPDSLTHMYLKQRVYQLYEVDISHLIKENVQLLGIAKEIEQEYYKVHSIPSKHKKISVLKLLSPSKVPSKPILFIVNAVDGKLHSFVPLASSMFPHVQVYGLYTTFKFKTIEQFAEYYLAEIRKVQEHGPFLIGGFSFGSWIAHAITVILESIGEKIECLLMIDPPVSIGGYNSEFADNFYSIVSFGMENIKVLMNSPTKDKLLLYGNNFQTEFNILNKYQSQPKPVTCSSLILLAEERLKLSGLSIVSVNDWKQWCSNDGIKVEVIPGNHGNCFSAINCSSIAKYFLNILGILSEVQDTSLIPVCSPHEVSATWKLQDIQSTSIDQNIESESLALSSLLRISSSGEYTCMLPKMVGEHRDLAVFNSCGILKAQSDPGKFHAEIHSSFTFPCLPSAAVNVLINIRNSDLLVMQSGNFETVWYKP